jgi:KaiC/GvpD/RAD55 family RecA-like ATPase
MAISAARSGSSLIIHGPPGTGKSQTIANVMASFMADGKSVLFVSEKTAALDMVKDRLDKKQLGVFCLDLHHGRRGNANKRSNTKAGIYQQLRDSVDDQKSVKTSEFDYDSLAQRRRQLNSVVRALHRFLLSGPKKGTRRPTGESWGQLVKYAKTSTSGSGCFF